jgi:amino acid transporter
MKKKFSEFIKKLTNCNNPRVNAFYDIGLRVLMIVAIINNMFERYLNVTYIIFMLGSLAIVIIFFVFLIINYTKRHKKGNLYPDTHTWNGIIAVLLFTIGVLINLPNSFMKNKIVILSLIALVLLIGSIVFYVLGYRELLKAEKSQ